MKYLFFLFNIIYVNFVYGQNYTSKDILNEFSSIRKNDSIKDFKMSNSRDSWDIYKLSFTIDANNIMFKNTKDKKYLNYNIKLIRNIIENSIISKKIKSSQFKDDFQSWANYSHNNKNYYGKEYPLFEFFGWRYIMQTLRIIKDENLTEYKKDYNSILNFTEENLIKKWEDRNYNNLYNNMHMHSYFASVNYDLYKLTKQKKYYTEFKIFLEKFNKSYDQKNQTITWNAAKNIQDVSHANGIVDLLIRLYEDNLIDKRIITLLINTTKNKIIKQNNKIAKNIDGTGIDPNQGILNDGFMKLGIYDKELSNFFVNQQMTKETVYYRKNQFLANKLNIIKNQH
ncbi:hypothetical protein [Empedobacter brevis]